MLRAALAALLLTAAPALADEGASHIEIHDPYAIQAVPTAPTGSAYMLIHNHASTPDRLLSVASPSAERVEVHSSTEEDGVLRMGPVEEPVEIPAGGLVLLKRGGVHLMFMGLAEPWEDGAMVPVTLTFEEAGEVAIEVPVDLDRLTEDGAAEEHGDGEAEASEGDHAGH
jgi:periplasmic copper chaperone A